MSNKDTGNKTKSHVEQLSNGENNDEDDGVLLFTALHGEMKQSFLVIVDAKTMQTIDEIPIPGDIVTFTTHGEWYSK